MKSTLNTIYNVDSRRISEILPKEVKIQTTISSPPYFDMKDYGTENQIGFGQSYEEYLRDVKSVFEQVYQYTKDDGTLWIIIDTFKRNDSIVLLPFDLAAMLKESGWLLQDIIIWKKDKTVPWSNNGFTQRKFEYVLFFSKSPKYKCNKDKVRIFDTRQLKKWWIKYPERYNPRGKALDEIWEYPIPVQGSWGKQYIRHFCPLPQDMVSNMIQISTDEGDVVFDPFAGSGTVLSQSAYMNRPYLGFELNRSYIEKFHSYLSGTLGTGKANYEKMLKKEGQAVFEETISNLRALKYGRVLLKMIETRFSLKGQLKIFVDAPMVRDDDISVKYGFIGASLSEDVISFISKTVTSPPLSKYGISPEFDFIFQLDKNRVTDCFFYSRTNTHSYLNGKHQDSKEVAVISPICVNLKESDYL